MSNPPDVALANGALHYLELNELALLIKSGAMASTTVTRMQLDRIMALGHALHSYTFVMADAAMDQARAADAEIASGHHRGPLHGVPIAVKDLFWTKGVPTRGGTTVHKDFLPTEDATVIRRLTEAGAVLLGKLQMTEGAYSDHHPSVTPPRNPWGHEYWPGISSSGPGVATAAGLCFGSLGTDTGGSIRWPCAANGLTGLKPTWGRVSRHGVLPLAPSLDHVGPMARSVIDVAVMLAAIAGADRDEPTARPEPVPDYLAIARHGARGLRIGIDSAWNSADVDAETQHVLSAAIKVFQELGAHLVEVQVPDVTQAIADWADICAVEAAVAHEATYPAQKSEYGPVLASVIDAGRELSGVNYEKAILRRMDFAGRLAALFSEIDLLLIPVQPFAPLTLDTIRTLGKQPELIARLQRYTCVFDMTGSPTLTLPAGFSAAGLPIAFQLVAADMAEAMLIRAGAAYQGATSWHRHHPAI